jgi:anti-sigma factor RsiW/cytoskeletal protein CcmA (bactofilin family)
MECSVYADGELPEGRIHEVSRHLESCGKCRRMADALQNERRVLVSCLQDVQLIEFELEDETLGAPQAERIGVAKFAALILSIAALLRPVFAALGQFRIPLSAAAQFNLFVETVIYGLPAAFNAIRTFLNIASWVAMIVIVSVLLFALFRRSPVISTVISILALLSVFSPWTYAFDVRRGEKPVSVPAGETIDDTLVVTGNSSVDIEGTINGDLIALAGDVRVKGTVKGNLVSFAERTEIDGNVEGSVVGTGGLVIVRGKVGRNLYGAAGSVTIEPESRILGNVSMLVGEASLDGAVEKDFNVRTARSIGWSPFSRDVFSRGGKIQVLRHAKVGRNLLMKVATEEDAIIDPAARTSIGGKTEVELTPPPPNRYATVSFYVWQTIWLAAAFIAGFLLLLAVPAFSRFSLDTGGALLSATAIGFVSAFVPPIAGVMAALTLIGLPLGLGLIGLWVLALYLSKIVIAVFLGRALFPSSRGRFEFALPLLGGLAVVFAAINLPYVGGVINFLLVILGMGGLVMTAYRLPGLRALSSVPALQT